MKNTLLIALTVIFAIGIGAIIVYIPLKQQQDKLDKKVESTVTENRGLIEKVNDLQERESQKIRKQIEEAQPEPKTGLAYFTSSTKPLGNSQTQIDITLMGDTAVDAVDLILTHDTTVTVKELKKGTAFVSYPRLLDKDGIITVTGIAMPQGNSFAYGKTGEVFVTLIVESKAGSTGLKLDASDTKAYFNGTPILDFTRSFKDIAL